MRRAAAAFSSGALFALGLGVAGMTKPSKVVGFLDVLGRWDASLVFVMFAAIAVYASLSRIIGKQEAPWLESAFRLPTRHDLDADLLGGAAIFGVGWGLGGYCPGPGIVAAASGSLPAIAFVVSMLVGMSVQQRWRGRRQPSSSDLPTR